MNHNVNLITGYYIPCDSYSSNYSDPEIVITLPIDNSLMAEHLDLNPM